MKILSLSAVAAALFLTACDRHQWEGEDGVKELYKSSNKPVDGSYDKKPGKAEGETKGKDEKEAH